MCGSASASSPSTVYRWSSAAPQTHQTTCPAMRFFPGHDQEDQLANAICRNTGLSTNSCSQRCPVPGVIDEHGMLTPARRKE